ncbi:hypothetical protein FSP39_004816 [Pinctada imbricata]|uniref:B box-type domain-containing protein n=1 Tax=Pinctada imbricata TaxID=66713 RepID=A0AA88XTG1_PINIB|nr:hypothetical protein FSP39_004816 [Pinctada imbricata]
MISTALIIEHQNEHRPTLRKLEVGPGVREKYASPVLQAASAIDVHAGICNGRPRSLDPPQSILECGKCEGNLDVSWFCKNCTASLCETCAKNHKTKRRYKSHTVVPRTYTVLRLYGPSKIAEQCRMHPEKEISTYCNKCDVPCCVSCLAKDHKRHDFSTIEDKYLDAEKGLNEYYRQLDTDIRPTLEEMEEQAKADAKDDDIHFERVVSAINNFRKDVVQNFNQACDDLISEVINLQSNNQKRLEDITRAKNNIDSLKRKIEKKIERGKLDMVKYNPPNIESLVPHFTSNIRAVPWFEPDTKILNLISESIGKIHIKEIEQERNADFSTRCRKHLNIQNIHSFYSKIGATSIIKSGNKPAWITDFGTSKMYLYNDLGEVVRSISVDG